MYRHTWAEIDLDALEYNISQITGLVPPERVMGVVKANAYGHGAGAVLDTLLKSNITRFAVSNAYEALDLRSRTDKGEILILGYTDPAAVGELAEAGITLCIFDLDYARAVSAAAVSVGVRVDCHIKVDSGMGRLGLRCSDEKEQAAAINEIFKLRGIRVTGAFTHFATADRDGDEAGEFTALQYRRFTAATKLIQRIGGENGAGQLVFHSANSAATLLDSEVRPSMLYRAGIILYGLTPSVGLELPFKPRAVMSLKTTVSQIKELAAGDTVSYGRSFTASKSMRVATVTAGYADGLHRALSNRGCLLIRGKRAPIIGRVCMDQTVVDVSNIPEVKTGDEAVIFGEGLPVEEAAQMLGTINYELVCDVAHRVPRAYIKNGKQIDFVRYNSI